MGTAAQDFWQGLPVVIRKILHGLGSGIALIASESLAVLWILSGFMTITRIVWSIPFSVWAWVACAYFCLGSAVIFVSYVICRGREARKALADSQSGNGPDPSKEEVDQIVGNARMLNITSSPSSPENRS